MNADDLATMVDQLRGATANIANDPRATAAARADAQAGLVKFDKLREQLAQVVDAQFIQAVTTMGGRCYSVAHLRGRWPADHEPGAPDTRTSSAALTLVESSFDALVQAVHDGTPGEDHAARLLIALLDLAHGRGWKLAERVLANHALDLEG